MPTLPVNGADLFYLDEGAGPETVFLGHGYLMTADLWDTVAEALVGAGYRVVRPDWRGQGRSEVTATGYDPWSLAADALGLLTQLGVERAHVVGHSMGGYVGYRMALRAPRRVASLVLIGTAAEDEKGEAMRQYTTLLWALRLLGYGAVMDRVLPILYGPDFLSDPARAAEVEAQVARIRSNDRTGVFRSGRGIFDRDDIRGQLAQIRVPTLVVTGDRDVPHPPAQSRPEAAQIPGARYVELPGVGHTPPAEAPDAVASLLLDWLADHA